MRSQLHRSDESIRSHIIRNGVHHVFAHLSTMSPVYTGRQPSGKTLMGGRVGPPKPKPRRGEAKTHIVFMVSGALQLSLPARAWALNRRIAVATLAFVRCPTSAFSCCLIRQKALA
jgi:hypothetical protein